MTQFSPLHTPLQASLEILTAKVGALEASRGPSPPRPKAPTAATDPFASRMLVFATAAGFKRTLFTRCPAEYYDWPLEKRRLFLQGASLHHLTKSIVMENTRHNGEDDCTDIAKSRYLCCVVPYTAKIDSDKLRDVIRKVGKEQGLEMPGAKGINYRLAGDCVDVTGYEPNAVTPLGLKRRMPVVVARQISQLAPGSFWLGGGEVSLKWRVEWEEFVQVFSPVVLHFAVTEDGY